MARFEKVSIEGISFTVNTNATKMITNAEMDKLNDMQTAIAGLTGEHADYITPPSGGTTTDTQARSAISAIIDALVASGILNPED
jgi:hypothetical protein